ncbi:MAG: hypothetical protein ACI9HK_002619 [Pirellulaceae bacterium]|jgi:hypothetical protein
MANVGAGLASAVASPFSPDSSLIVLHSSLFVLRSSFFDHHSSAESANPNRLVRLAAHFTMMSRALEV